MKLGITTPLGLEFLHVDDQQVHAFESLEEHIAATLVTCDSDTYEVCCNKKGKVAGEAHAAPSPIDFGLRVAFWLSRC